MSRSFRPATRLEGYRTYKPKTGAAPQYKVDANEASASSERLDGFLASLSSEVLNRYTRPHALEADLAARFSVRPEQVVVTAGADDGLFRLCLLTVEPGRQAVVTRPSFEMIPRYARLAGGSVQAIEWFGAPFPTDDFAAAIDAQTSIAFMVTPSSPAGEVVDRAALERVSEACRAHGALLVLDHAYAEFADEDLTGPALELGNVVVARTFSKAWGLAGLRVGYFLGPVDVIEGMKTVGQPYAVATPSVAGARAALAHGQDRMRIQVARVREERAALTAALQQLGADPVPSQGNFVFARLGDRGEAFVKAMAARGVGVRWFDGPPPISGGVRITCPGDAEAFGAIQRALPQAMKEVQS